MDNVHWMYVTAQMSIKRVIYKYPFTLGAFHCVFQLLLHLAKRTRMHQLRRATLENRSANKM